MRHIIVRPIPAAFGSTLYATRPVTASGPPGNRALADRENSQPPGSKQPLNTAG